MKSLILTLLFSALIINSHAQNGGQFPENNSVKIEFVASNNMGQAIVKLYNKQSCIAVIRCLDRTISIAGNSYDTLHMTVPTNNKITAKTETNCGSADFGLIELIINRAALPVNFVSFTAKAIGDKKVLVTFTTAQSVNLKQFNIKVSFDRNNWKIVTVMFPDDVQPNRTYTATLDFNKIKK